MPDSTPAIHEPQATRGPRSRRRPARRRAAGRRSPGSASTQPRTPHRTACAGVSDAGRNAKLPAPRTRATPGLSKPCAAVGPCRTGAHLLLGDPRLHPHLPAKTRPGEHEAIRPVAGTTSTTTCPSARGARPRGQRLAASCDPPEDLLERGQVERQRRPTGPQVPGPPAVGRHPLRRAPRGHDALRLLHPPSAVWREPARCVPPPADRPRRAAPPAGRRPPRQGSRCPRRPRSRDSLCRLVSND